jgi:hypothetical protein
MLRSTGVVKLSVTDLLDISGEFRPIQPKNRELMSFVGAHADILLKHAFAPEMDRRSKMAFLLLSNPSDYVYDGLLEDDRFFLHATEVLARPKVSPCHVSRLSSLFGNIALNTDAKLTTSVCFLFQLLPFICEVAVLELFSTVCSTVGHLVGLQRVLAKSSFAELVLKQLKGETEVGAMANLCVLISVCLKQPVLHSCFASEKVLDVLTGLTKSDDVVLLNHVWKALGGMGTDVFVSKMTGLLPKVLERFRRVTELHTHHVHAFEFLGQLVRYWPVCFDDDVTSEVLNVVLRLMVLFPDATHLQNCVFRFLRSAVKYEPLMRAIFEVLFPVLVEEAESEARNAVAANARSFLVDVEHSRGQNKFVDRFLQADEQFLICEKKTLLKFMVAPRSGYGGAVVCRRCKSDDALRHRMTPIEDLD